MEEIKRVISRRISLNEVARATLGVNKSADGLQAVRYYHRGKWQELERYCLTDVRMTGDLSNFGCQNKHVKMLESYSLGNSEIRVNWHLQEREFVKTVTDIHRYSLF